MKSDDIEIKFKQYREHLKNEIQRLSIYVYLYKHLHERKQDRLAEMNLAPCFFGTVLDSLFSCIIHWVHNLIDSKSQRGFIDFLKFVENNCDTFSISNLQKRRNYPDNHWVLKREPITSESIASDRQKLLGLQSLQSIKTRRDKFHAHFDKAYAFERSQLSKDAPIRWCDLDEIIETMKDVFNTYSTAYDGTSYSIEPMNISDVDYILDILHQHNQRNKC
jgi:hypothetical protein